MDVLLPYLYGGYITQTPSNQEKEYPEIDLIFKKSLFEHQVEVAQEALNNVTTLGSTIIGLYTSFGKTAIAIWISCQLRVKTAILFHRKILCPQWKGGFEKFTNIENRIHIVGMKAKQNCPFEDSMVVLCTDKKYSKLTEEQRMSIGLLIIDEADKFCTKSRVPCLLSFEPKYVIAETATLEREDEMHSMIYKICGTRGIFKMSTKPFTVYKHETMVSPVMGFTESGDPDYTKLVNDLAESAERNRQIIELVKRHADKKILILTLRVDQVTLLTELLQAQGEKVDYMSGNKDTYSDSRVLIGTPSKIGVGFDEESACPNYNGRRIDLLIMCASFKNMAALEQSVGRVFRSEIPMVIHLVDDNPIIKRHWMKAKKWYMSRNGIVRE